MIPAFLLAATTSWAWLGPILAAFGGVATGVAAVMAQRNKAKTDKVDYHNSLLGAMQQHLAYMSGENESQRKRLDDLTTQVQRCQNDKYEMQVKLAEWERKWEEKLRGSNPSA